MIEGIADIVRIVLAFALMGFVTWLWGQVNKYLIDNYLSKVLNAELSVRGVMA